MTSVDMIIDHVFVTNSLLINNVACNTQLTINFNDSGDKVLHASRKYRSDYHNHKTHLYNFTTNVHIRKRKRRLGIEYQENRLVK